MDRRRLVCERLAMKTLGLTQQQAAEI